MTLEQIKQSLPNGLHDATICSFSRDIEKETLVFRIGILVGLPDDPPECRDRYRDGIITFSGVKLFIVERPEPSSAFHAPGRVFFRIDRSESKKLSREIGNRLSSGINFYSIFVLDWESSIHLSASDISFDWA